MFLTPFHLYDNGDTNFSHKIFINLCKMHEKVKKLLTILLSFISFHFLISLIVNTNYLNNNYINIFYLREDR